MTERPPRSRPAVAARIMVTGASVTSVLGMTAAMGSAAKQPSEPSEIPVGTAIGGASVADVASVVVMPVTSVVDPAADAVPLPAPSVPVVAEVIAPAPDPAPAPTPATVAPSAPAVVQPEASTVAPTPVPETAPVATPAPIVVQIPTPAPSPRPDASTSKSN